MKSFIVSWEIELDAESHEEAARRALSIQRDPHSSALVFDVKNAARWKDRKAVDLWQE